MTTRTDMLRIDDLDADLRTVESFECTLAQFCEDNECMDPADLADVVALPVGECMLLGGGAAACCRIARVA